MELEHLRAAVAEVAPTETVRARITVDILAATDTEKVPDEGWDRNLTPAVVAASVADADVAWAEKAAKKMRSADAIDALAARDRRVRVVASLLANPTTRRQTLAELLAANWARLEANRRRRRMAVIAALRCGWEVPEGAVETAELAEAIAEVPHPARDIHPETAFLYLWRTISDSDSSFDFRTNDSWWEAIASVPEPQRTRWAARLVTEMIAQKREPYVAYLTGGLITPDLYLMLVSAGMGGRAAQVRQFFEDLGYATFEDVRHITSFTEEGAEFAAEAAEAYANARGYSRDLPAVAGMGAIMCGTEGEARREALAAIHAGEVTYRAQLYGSDLITAEEAIYLASGSELTWEQAETIRSRDDITEEVWWREVLPHLSVESIPDAVEAGEDEHGIARVVWGRWLRAPRWNRTTDELSAHTGRVAESDVLDDLLSGFDLEGAQSAMERCGATKAFFGKYLARRLGTDDTPWSSFLDLAPNWEGTIGDLCSLVA